jgi:shikimate kinase
MTEDINIPENIYLMGMPGSGKSTLGRAISKSLGIGFYDLDQFIEEEGGQDINAIFKLQGEQGFRMTEKSCLKKLSELPGPKVIATGGGTPCFHHNIDYINQQGASIFLDVPLEVIADRLLQQGIEERPLLKDTTPQQLLGRLHDHFMKRKSYYLKALIHLEGSSISPEQILNELRLL